jgi:uncharacterized Ntn-hydrolase superfamily protein
MTFFGSTGALGGRLLAVMRAGLDAGGEEGPVHSSGLLIVRDVSWPVANLWVDWSDADPIADLERLWALYEPQLEAYVTRAIDPAAAPSFGAGGTSKLPPCAVPLLPAPTIARAHRPP